MGKEWRLTMIKELLIKEDQYLQDIIMMENFSLFKKTIKKTINALAGVA